MIEEIIKKYSDHWREVTCGDDEDLYQALRELLMFSTAVGAWEPGQDVPEMFENSVAILCSMDADKLEQLICEVNEEKQFEGKLNPLEPDLIGEYYVLDYWKKKKYDRRYLQNLVNELWKYPWGFAQFIGRCIQNYGKQDAFQYLFQNGMERLCSLENSEMQTLLFSMLLVNLINEQDEKRARESVKRLEELNRNYGGNEEIALAYAKGLVNLSNKQKEERAKESISCLKKLNEKYEGNEEIALEYAKGLVNLSNKQKGEGAKESISCLKKLNEKYEGNEEIALEYAKGLVNLSNKQKGEGAKESISCLKKLNEKYEGNEEIALACAQGLFNLSCEQNEEEASRTRGCLDEIRKKYRMVDEWFVSFFQEIENK